MSTQTQTASPQQSTETLTETPASEPKQSNESALRALARELGEASEASAKETVKTAEKAADEKKTAKTKPKNLAALAETLGIEVAELYDLEIPSSIDGEQPFTLGKLKDHMTEREDFTVRSLKFEEEKRQKEADYLRANEELQELISTLPKDAIKPETINKAREKMAKRRQIESAKTLEAISEWSDEKIREADLTEIVEHLSSYGFPESHILSIMDHRMFKMLRDFTKQTKRLQKAIAMVKEAQKPGASGKSPNPKGAVASKKGRSFDEQKRAKMFSEVFNQ
jgi:hypothetical protein